MFDFQKLKWNDLEMALFILDFSYCGVNFYAYLEVKADLEMWIHEMGTVTISSFVVQFYLNNHDSDSITSSSALAWIFASSLSESSVADCYPVFYRVNFEIRS